MAVPKLTPVLLSVDAGAEYACTPVEPSLSGGWLIAESSLCLLGRRECRRLPAAGCSSGKSKKSVRVPFFDDGRGEPSSDGGRVASIGAEADGII